MLAAALAAPTAAVVLDDDAALPLTVGRKTLSDVEMLLQDRYDLLSEAEVRASLGPLTPPCAFDTECWQAVASQLGVARLLVLSLHGQPDTDVATVFVVDRWGEVTRSQATLPRGGGFPLELVEWLVEHPPPAEPVVADPSFWSRLFGRD